MQQAVSPFAPSVVHSAEPRRWIVQSATDPTTFYDVFQVTPTGWRCTCPAGERGIPCKHVRWVVAEKAQLSEMLGREIEELYRSASAAELGRLAKSATYEAIWGVDGDGGR